MSRVIARIAIQPRRPLQYPIFTKVSLYTLPQLRGTVLQSRWNAADDTVIDNRGG
jgi:hypothetical protein